MLGTVTDVMDSSGNIVQRYDYTAYGKIRSLKDGAGSDITSDPAISTSFTFTGREYDSEVGLYYYRARYYDANIGRFLQQDPDPGKLNIPSTLVNKYIYAMNNPIMLKDPSGMSWLSDLVDYAFVGLAGIYNILVGIITLDPAMILSGLALAVEFVLGPVGLVMNGRLPKAGKFHGAWYVENSVTTELFAGGTSYSLGPVMFLQAEWRMKEKGDTLEQVRMHEYGHYLQYKEWGGWKYISVGNGQKGDECGFLEQDADRRAGDFFGPGYVPSYECR